MKEKRKKAVKNTGPIALPEVMTKIYQPNRITQAHLPLTLMQHKIFAYIMLQLQTPIKEVMKGNSQGQLDFFSHPDYVKIPIHLNKLMADSSNYRHVKNAIRKLASVVVSFPYRNKEGVGMERITGLIRADIPIEPTGSSIVTIEIENHIAKLLTNIEKNNDNLPINYTSYYFEIVNHSKSQYTPQLYPYIASWRKKGGFSISMDDLKSLLSISDMYDRFYDFKKKVLEPVQRDLSDLNSDCWFNCNLKDFKTIENGKIMLNFKVITPEYRKQIEKQDENILSMLRNYSLNSQQLAKLKEILKESELDRNLLLKRISEIDDFIYKNNTNSEKANIENKANYMYKALIKQFGTLNSTVN